MSSIALYTAMTALQAADYRQTIQANNLANVNTTGFRSELAVLETTPFEGPPAIQGVADVVTRNSGYSHKQGALNKTGSPWDIALNGSGWLVTKDANGRTLLTRDGRLHRGPDGLVHTQNGNVVLGANKNPISLPKMDKLVIGRDGVISGVPVGQGVRQAQQFNRLFIAQTPQGHLARVGASSFASPVRAPSLQRNPQAAIEQGYLEGSDVSPVTTMTHLIKDMRSFQLSTRFIQSNKQAGQGLDALISKA